MLYILTGNIQIGKTRWLESLVSELHDAGVESYGVLAPGVWREGVGEDGEPSFEKLGIDNKLLPSGRIVPLARRRDLAKAQGVFDENSQSAKASLGWEMSDDALAEVNEHFRNLAAGSSEEKQDRGLLVIDELGPLELLRGGGLVEALALLESGPNARWGHALVIVRESLVDLAVERFSRSWSEVEVVAPGEEAKSKVVRLFDECVS